jgi:hypothetical protein
MARRKPNERAAYVVGKKECGFCWLLAIDPGQIADDQNIEMARQFVSLKEAEEVSLECGGNVYEIVNEATWPATLKEV